MRRSLAIALAVLGWMALAPAAALAQWPGEVTGRVTDASSGGPVEAAAVELPALGRSTTTDAAGRFRLRGVDPGEHRVVVRRTGYASAERTVAVRNGAVARLDAALAPVPVALEALRATVARDRLAAGATLERAAIEASGARTAADVVSRLPGVTVHGMGVTGQQTVSVRGSAADAVLVLVDGVPLNDPVTGEADLSTLPAQSVERVTLLPGARTSRYGPRAVAGVVLVETRAPDARAFGRAWAGALGERALQGEWGASPGRGASLGLGGAARRMSGSFDHERDPNDRRIVRRANSDLEEASAFAAARAPLAGGELRLTAGAEALDRGLPGLGFAPSLRARQEVTRLRGGASWRRTGTDGGVDASLSGAWHDGRHRDPDPPFGLPYDERTRVSHVHARVEGERFVERHGVRVVGAGVDAQRQAVDGGGLSPAAPDARTDGGAFVRAALGRDAGAWALGLAADLRADRDGRTGGWHGTHGVTASASRGGLRAQVAHRSAYAPPTLGDQFFREGVAVAANPDLRPERVPGEWEAGVTAEGRVAGLDVSGGGTAYRGSVRGMITWLPDFRFVWSPRNTNALRRGGEAWATVAAPAAGLRVHGQWQRAVLTYDRGGGDDTVQVAYRPRHGAQLRAEWARGPWRLEAAARYTGERNTSPSTANPLPGFWSVEAAAARDWRVGGWTLTTAVDVDRLRDERASLLYGYPEPGRRLRVDVRVRRGAP